MSSKNKMLIFGLCSTSDDRPSDFSNEHRPKSNKMKKGPQCHWKIKCLFLDYVQLLMIGQVIKATKVDWNAKKTPKSSRNGMLGFGLCSTSDDRPSDLNDKRWPKHKKVKKGPLCQWKIKCSFMDDVQLLMISWAIWATNVDWNAKKQRKAPMSLIN